MIESLESYRSPTLCRGLSINHNLRAKESSMVSVKWVEELGISTKAIDLSVKHGMINKPSIFFWPYRNLQDSEWTLIELQRFLIGPQCVAY